MRKLRCAILLILMLMCLSVIHAVNDMPIIAAFQGEHHNSKYGYSMVSLDFNHDGFDDLAVCSFAYGYNYGITPARGKVYIYYGGVGFNSATPASVTIEGTYANSVGRRIWEIYGVRQTRFIVILTMMNMTILGFVCGERTM